MELDTSTHTCPSAAENWSKKSLRFKKDYTYGTENAPWRQFVLAKTNDPSPIAVRQNRPVTYEKLSSNTGVESLIYNKEKKRGEGTLKQIAT